MTGDSFTANFQGYSFYFCLIAVYFPYRR